MKGAARRLARTVVEREGLLTRHTLVDALQALQVPTERWALQGFLESVDAGPPRRFGFGFRVRKSAFPGPVRMEAWRASLSLADLAAEQQHTEQRWVLPPRNRSVYSSLPLCIRVGGARTRERAEEWRLEGCEGAWTLRSRFHDGRGLDLDLRSDAQTLDLSRYLDSDGHWEAEPRLDAQGTLFDGSRLRRVAGTVWGDRVFRGGREHSIGVAEVVRVHLDTGQSLFAFRAPDPASGSSTATGVACTADGTVMWGVPIAWADCTAASDSEANWSQIATSLCTNGFGLRGTPLVRDGPASAAAEPLRPAWPRFFSVRGFCNDQPVSGWATTTDGRIA